MNTKAIYMPKGKAGEYAKYACNFYVGCSNDCEYCYCKKGVLGHALGKPVAKLKKCFDGHKPHSIFIKELHEHITELREHGLFFSFTTDPLLPETQELTNAAVLYAVNNGVPCKLLTKRADFKVLNSFHYFTNLIAYGFTLTGMDAMELHASTNEERISTMRYLHDREFKTFASIEPIINLDKSMQMIEQSLGYCDLYKIGLLTGHKEYSPEEVEKFMILVSDTIREYRTNHPQRPPYVYFKDSMYQYIKRNRNDFLTGTTYIVNNDFNLFKLQ